MCSVTTLEAKHLVAFQAFVDFVAWECKECLITESALILLQEQIRKSIVHLTMIIQLVKYEKSKMIKKMNEETKKLLSKKLGRYFFPRQDSLRNLFLQVPH